MSFSQTYFEELHEQSKDLVEILEHTQEERVLYALCVVYQQLAFAEQEPPIDAEEFLQQHAERLEKYVQSKDIDSMLYQLVQSDDAASDILYDLHELSFVLDYLGIEEDHIASMENIQKVIQSFPELYSSLCGRAQKLLASSKNPSRFFDDVLQAIVDTASAKVRENIRLSDDEINTIFADIEAEEAPDIEAEVGVVIYVNFAGLKQATKLEAADVRMTANAGMKKKVNAVLFENDRFQLVLIRTNSDVALYLIPKGGIIEKPVIKRNEDPVEVRAFATGWCWDFDEGRYSMMIEGTECTLVIQDES